MQSLKTAVLRGSAWTLSGVAAGQIIRLGKSLVLSRLLFPEAYGVMAIVWAVLTCLDLLSDVGLSPGIVRSPRGDDPYFLNTAWTMKSIRGTVLCGIVCAIAYPVSMFYHKPQLALLLPVAGLTVLIEGLGSTNTYSCQRNMTYSRITMLELLNEIVGMVVTLGWALIHPSVWALLGGAVAGRTSQVLGSHLLLPGIRNRFHWDPAAFSELVNFGKWVFFSSAIYLLYAQGDRLLLGRFLDSKLLGVYSIAIMLSEAISGVINKLTDTVLFPALSQTAISDRSRLRSVLYQMRLGTDVLIIMPIGVLMVIGGVVVKLLYDSRYQGAGWMLQILSIRLIMVSMVLGGTSSLFALGHSRYSVGLNICRAIWIFTMIPLGWHFYGMKGIVCAVALTELPAFVVIWSGMAKYKLLSLPHEMRSVAFAIAGIAIGYAVLLATRLFGLQ
jgi:O-antigen/teichoic acid export membrane protein